MTNTLIAKLYLAINENATASQIDAAILDDSAEAAIVALSPEAFLEASYQAAFGRSVDAEGSAYYLPKLEDGTISQDDFAAILVAGADAYPADGIAADLAATDAEIAANKVAAEVIAEASGISAGNTASILATVETSTGGGVADEDEDETTDDDTVVTDESQMVVLTDGRDNVTTGTNDDIIYGDAGQNQNGAIANAFATGDMIDGGAGQDTLITSIIGDNGVDNGETIAINARVSNVEIATFEAIDQSVTVDAGRMDSVEEYWSDNSDNVTLTLEDVRLGDLAITKDITFGMKDVDFDSNLTVQFDSASLTNAGDSQSDSQVSIKLIDATALTVDAPVGNVSVTLGFDVAGDTYTLANVVSTDGTYEGLKDAIATELAVKGLTDLSVSLGDSFTELTTGNNTTETLTGVTAQEIIITDGSGDEFTNVTFTQAAVEAVPTGFTVAGVAASVDPQTSSAMIETNLILDNAGRESTAGDVIIGAMSNSDKGVELFNVMVDHSSAIASLATTNNKMDTVVITSLTNNGSLEIGAINDTALTLINASAFEGANLMLGQTSEDTGTAISNLTTLKANIAANVRLDADAQAGSAYSYTTGSGSDTINVNISGNAVDASGESFTLDTNGGSDIITVTMDAGVSVATMAQLNNLTISATSDEDTVNLNAYGTFNITTGNDSDYVRVNSADANGDAETGIWAVGQTTGAQDFGSKVLYKASVTVSFAGFEETVTVDTDANGNFIATQMTINEAIIDAIDSNPELSTLLNYGETTGNQQLVITSTVGGENSLAIAIYQPQLVASSTDLSETGSNVLIDSTDVTALRQGLIATEALDSDDLEDASEIVTATNALNSFYGSIDSDNAGNEVLYSDAQIMHDNANVNGDIGIDILDEASAANDLYVDYSTGGSLDSTIGYNLSTIDLGDGANDLVVLHSRDNNVNTIKISDDFGKVSVVNFHNEATNNVDSKAEVGTNALDFSKYLDNQIDPSATSNVDSATTITTTVNIVDSAEAFADSATGDNEAVANSVNIIRFNNDADAAFTSLTAATLKAALNDTAEDGSKDFGNIDGDLLTAVDAEDGTQFMGTTQDHIIMVENDLNEGEYKVFHATSTLDTDGDVVDDGEFASMVELGTLDFGASVNLTVAGTTEYANALTAVKSYFEAELDYGVAVDADNFEAVTGEPVVVDPVDPDPVDPDPVDPDPVDPDPVDPDPVDPDPVDPDPVYDETATVEDSITYDATTGDNLYEIAMSVASAEFATLTGFATGDALDIDDAYLPTENMMIATTGTTEINFGFGDMSDFAPAWVVSFTDQDADFVAAVDAAADADAALVLMTNEYGDGWLM